MFLLDIREPNEGFVYFEVNNSEGNRILGSKLPNIFPPFPEREDFEIYASMTPVKEVGGAPQFDDLTMLCLHLR